MTAWKQFTARVDARAAEILRRKHLKGKNKELAWDWHAWNLALSLSPSVVLLGVYMHKEKLMLDEAERREKIMEQTGISSRGYLMPRREVREKVQEMLKSSGGRGYSDFPDLPAKGTAVTSIGGVDDEKWQGLLERVEQMERRLNEVEQTDDNGARTLGSNQAESTTGVTSDTTCNINHQEERAEAKEGKEDEESWSILQWLTGMSEAGRNAVADKVAEARHWILDRGAEAVDWAAEEADATGRWALNSGLRLAQELLEAGKDWIGVRVDIGEGKGQEEREEFTAASEINGGTSGTEHNDAEIRQEKQDYED